LRNAAELKVSSSAARESLSKLAFHVFQSKNNEQRKWGREKREYSACSLFPRRAANWQRGTKRDLGRRLILAAQETLSRSKDRRDVMDDKAKKSRDITSDQQKLHHG